MNTFFRTIWLITLLFTSSPAFLAAAETTPAASAAVDAEYTITVIPFYGPEKIWALYTPFVDYLKQSTGKPWTLKLFPDHQALIDGFCGGQVAVALLGPVPLGKVMAQCNAEPLVVALGNDNTPFYRSILVSTDPDITSLAGLKGKQVGFFKGSTAAHILPRQLLRQAGLNKGDFVPVFLQSQDDIVNALLGRRITAAGLKDALFNKFKDKGFRILATSDPLPNFSFAAAPGVTDVTRKLFAETMLRLAPTSNELDRKQMSTWDDEIRKGFVPTTDAFRNSVKDLLVLTDEIMHEDR